MPAQIQTIYVPGPLNIPGSNCYLIQTAQGFLLIDTGMPGGRKRLVSTLERAGCRPDNLQLILLTHGDFDHIGSAAYLRERFQAKIAMHPDDAGMAERADLFWNRGKGSALLRFLVPLIFGFRRSDRFSPDLALQDGCDLSSYGWEACVVGLPGHSKGSIGVLTAEGDLFCGDLWMMDPKTGPSLGFGDAAGFTPALDRVRRLPVRRVYPGHGLPFPIEQVHLDSGQ